MPLKRVSLGALILIGLEAASASAQLNLPISPAAAGSDGIFNPAANIAVDLSQAVTGTWDMVSPMPGKGVYDPDKWMVVFKYNSVNVATGRTVTFLNHPSRAPVVWLVTGDTGIDPNAGNVTIAGTVSLDGKISVLASLSQGPAEPGPGGGRGGAPAGLSVTGLNGSAGFGPGAGRYPDSGTSTISGAGGSYSTSGDGLNSGLVGPVYGNASVLPLIGGSGGAGGRHSNAAGGGGGGGAILIAARSTVTITGTLRSNGGASSVDGGSARGGGGSGGAIRIVGDIVQGNGLKQALAGTAQASFVGGAGRIRVEANNAIGLTDGTPPIEFGFPADPVLIVPPPASPTLTIAEIETHTVPADPKASLGFPLPPDVTISNPFPISVRIEARNMPLNWNVNLRVVPKHGTDLRLPAVMQPGGTVALSIWDVSNIQVANGFHSLQAHAVAP